MFSFCGLEQSERVKRYIKSQQYKNMNYKYKEKPGKDAIKIIEHITDRYRQLYKDAKPAAC